METICPLCNSDENSIIYEMNNVPAHIGIQWAQKELALNCPKGDISLIFCRKCTFIWNSKFDPTIIEYGEAYDNTLHYSGLYQEYASSIANYLIERYDVRNKDVIDIGCGQGEFLNMLCDFGNNRGVGFDPSYDEEQVDYAQAENIKIIKEFYSEEYASYPADLICSRYVLEHIYDPKGLLNMLHRSIGDRLNTTVYFEVPHVQLILQDLSIWDIIYEHFSCFSPYSLECIFTLCGFNVLKVNQTYHGQLLTIESQPSDRRIEFKFEKTEKFREIINSVDRFEENVKNKLDGWRRIQNRIEGQNQRAVTWGAGAKGVSFLNMLELQDQVEYIIDINPNKHGKFIGGSGQQIMAPEFLREYSPDVILIMNPIYESEIRQQVSELGLERDLEFICI